MSRIYQTERELTARKADGLEAGGCMVCMSGHGRYPHHVVLVFMLGSFEARLCLRHSRKLRALLSEAERR